MSLVVVNEIHLLKSENGLLFQECPMPIIKLLFFGPLPVFCKNYEFF